MNAYFLLTAISSQRRPLLSQKFVLHPELANFLLQRLELSPLRDRQFLWLGAVPLSVRRDPVPQSLLHQSKFTRNVSDRPGFVRHLPHRRIPKLRGILTSKLAHHFSDLLP